MRVPVGVAEDHAVVDRVHGDAVEASGHGSRTTRAGDTSPPAIWRSFQASGHCSTPAACTPGTRQPYSSSTDPSGTPPELRDGLVPTIPHTTSTPSSVLITPRLTIFGSGTDRGARIALRGRSPETRRAGLRRPLGLTNRLARPTCRSGRGSELELESQLELARRADRVGDLAGGRAECEHLCLGVAGEHGVVRQTEVRAVEDVEPLDADLDATARRHPEVLEHRHVPRGEARSGERVAAQVAERAFGRHREAGRVEVLVRAAEHRVVRAAGVQVRPLAGAARARQRARAVEAEHRRERHAGPQGDDARELPAVRENARHAGLVLRRTAAPTCS